MSFYPFEYKFYWLSLWSGFFSNALRSCWNFMQRLLISLVRNNFVLSTSMKSAPVLLNINIVEKARNCVGPKLCGSCHRDSWMKICQVEFFVYCIFRPECFSAIFTRKRIRFTSKDFQYSSCVMSLKYLSTQEKIILVILWGP